MDQKPAEKARGGEIVLNTPARRVIFLTGLIGAVVLAVVLMIVRRLPGIARDCQVISRRNLICSGAHGRGGHLFSAGNFSSPVKPTKNICVVAKPDQWR